MRSEFSLNIKYEHIERFESVLHHFKYHILALDSVWVWRMSGLTRDGTTERG